MKTLNFYIMKTYIILALLILFSFHSKAQGNVGLYVNNFDEIVGNTTKETELLEYAQANGFNYLLLYKLHTIHTTMFLIDDIVQSAPLANFIENAKLNYGILKVAAVGEKNSSFDKIKTYNSFFPAGSFKRFDVFNLEFEYWNTSKVNPGGYYCDTYLDGTYPCTIDGAFDFYIDQLSMLKAYGAENNILIETYIGKLYVITNAQIAQLVQNTDRILVHYYRQSDVYNGDDADPSNDYSIYQYQTGHPDRIQQLATNVGAAGNTVTVMPIFSSRVAHMYAWLATHPLTQPYDTYLNGIDGFNDQVGAWKSQVNFDGYVWYRYTELLEIAVLSTTESEAYENQNIYYNQYQKRIYFNNFDINSDAQIFDIHGKKITQFKIATFYQIDKTMQKGVYFIKTQNNNTIRNFKILIY